LSRLGTRQTLHHRHKIFQELAQLDQEVVSILKIPTSKNYGQEKFEHVNLLNINTFSEAKTLL
jgi:hypothetical protein